MATGMELLTALANSIRSKSGATGKLTLAQMKTAVDGIIVPSGSISITTNGSHNVTNYATASVNVPASAVTSGTKTITTNGSHDVTTYKTANVNVPIPSGYIKPSGNINITSTSSFDVTNYATAIVSDSDLIAGNIKEGVNILGITGTCSAVTFVNSTPINIRPSGTLDGTSLWANVNIDIIGYTTFGVIFTYEITAGTSKTSGTTSANWEEYSVSVEMTSGDLLNSSGNEFSVIVKPWATAWGTGSTASRVTKKGYFMVWTNTATFGQQASSVAVTATLKTTRQKAAASASGTLTFTL